MVGYTLMVARQFPTNHPRRGEPTNFVENIGKTKIHTIRSNFELWQDRFDKIAGWKAVLNLKYWEGRPYHSTPIHFLTLDKKDGIGIQNLKFADSLYDFAIDYRYPYVDFNKVAENDGLTEIDAQNWFRKYDLSKPMALIQLTEFRY